jgi:hypothetical protein
MGERLIGSAMYCLKAGITPENISIGIAGAIFYNGDDESSQKLKQIKNLNGVEGVLKEICKVEETSPLFNLIMEAIKKLKDKNWL